MRPLDLRRRKNDVQVSDKFLEVNGKILKISILYFVPCACLEDSNKMIQYWITHFKLSFALLAVFGGYSLNFVWATICRISVGFQLQSVGCDVSTASFRSHSIWWLFRKTCRASVMSKHSRKLDCACSFVVQDCPSP